MYPLLMFQVPWKLWLPNLFFWRRLLNTKIVLKKRHRWCYFSSGKEKGRNFGGLCANFCTKPFFLFSFFWTRLKTFCFPSQTFCLNFRHFVFFIFTKSGIFSGWPFCKEQNVMHVIDTELHQKRWSKTKGKACYNGQDWW